MSSARESVASGGSDSLPGANLHEDSDELPDVAAALGLRWSCSSTQGSAVRNVGSPFLRHRRMLPV
jgi:hypothetical protein